MDWNFKPTTLEEAQAAIAREIADYEHMQAMIKKALEQQRFQQMQQQVQLDNYLNQQELLNNAPWLAAQSSELDLQIEQAYYQGLTEAE